MTLKLAVPPLAAISWAEAKQHLRIDDDIEQPYVEALIAAATQWLDGYGGILGRAIMTQSWDLTYDAFPAAEVELRLGPVASVTGVYYVDPDTGLEVTLATDQYAVDKGAAFRGWVVPATVWPLTMVTLDAMRVRFVVGSETVPPAIRQLILLIVGHWYANRETVVTGTIATAMPFAAEALLTQCRAWSL